MKVYRASYVLGTNYYEKGELIGIFDFAQKEHTDYEKIEDGYCRWDGWLRDELKDETTAYSPYCHVISEKYFERQLTIDELEVLEREMKLECIAALAQKKKVMVASLDKQIDYIQRRIDRE